jgi:hypothetical protein
MAGLLIIVGEVRVRESMFLAIALILLISVFSLAPKRQTCGFPTWLPPMLLLRVASSWWPVARRVQVLLLWVALTRYPWVQQ